MKNRKKNIENDRPNERKSKEKKQIEYGIIGMKMRTERDRVGKANEKKEKKRNREIDRI